MAIIRTPEERFDRIINFPYKPRYIEINRMRVHYIDEGEGETILCLHGEPTWSYLYRKMIPILTKKNRIIAMDFIGFGRSDKLTTIEEYTYQLHLTTLIEFIHKLDLKRVTLVVQDWGGLLGLRVAGEYPNRFSRLVIMNTGLPTGKKVNDAFLSWREFVQNTLDLPISQVIEMGLFNKDILTKAIVEAYEAPFPDISYKNGARAWPLLVPIHPDDPVAKEMLKARENLKQWKKPTLVMFSNKDPITRGADKFFRELIPSAKDQPEIIINNAGHFLQEDKGEEIAQEIFNFIQRTKV